MSLESDMSSILFTPQEIADITGGYWENMTKELNIQEFHHTYHYLKEGDAFVVISPNWPNQNAYKPNEHKIQRAIDKGISALIIKNDIKVDADIPILKVENTYFAIKRLAEYASKNAKANKVLISGSYGKTGFKTHLHHIIKNQKNSYTRLNSANYAASSYCNLASIKKENELFLMEIPIANREKMTRRSKLISPDISVITSIGHEGIERWKNVNRVIRYKLLIAKYLPKGGKLLLPYDDRYYSSILKEAQKYEDINILTYGSSSSCNAHVLYKKFTDFGWDVIAKIENKIVAYRVPFFEEYAVSNSLGELLCAYHLGADIHKAANKYYGCTNFKSSGLFYQVNLNNKRFYLYDQSNRGGLEAYESFFKTLNYIEPKNSGKKILVTSEFLDYKDGEIELIDTDVFQKLIASSGIEVLYTVEKFSEHINVLQDKSIWKNHSLDYHNIQDEILNSIENDDILSIKGIFESNLPSFIKDIKAIDGIKIKKVISQNSMKNQNEVFKDLRCLDISDLDNFKQHISIERKKLWIYYFPFLYFWSLSSSRELLIGEEEGSLKLFLFDKFHRTTMPNLALYIPPAPFNAKVLDNSFANVNKYKNEKNEKIVWVDRDDLIKIKKDKRFEHIKFKFKEEEFITLLKKWENTAKDKNTFFEINDMAMTHNKRMLRPVKMEKVYKAHSSSKKRKILLTKENLLLYTFDKEKFEIKLLDESYLSQLKIVQENAEVTDDEYFSEKYFLKYLNKKEIYGFIAKKTGELYGYCVVKTRGKWIEIFQLAVSKKHQRHGYATALILHAINKLLKQGKEFIYLVVDTKKTEAKRLYKKLGFKTEKLIKDYFKNVDVFEMNYGE